MYTRTAQSRPEGCTATLLNIVLIVLVLGFAAAMVVRSGLIGGLSTPSIPLPAPTPIIRVVQPYVEEAPAPAQVVPSVAPAAVAPVTSQEGPGATEPTPVVARQVIVVKNGANPAAAPIVIDRGTKRKTP